jgi:type I restriction enzyme R subunit
MIPMSERTAVQNPMLRYADDIGWDYVSATKALQLRGGEAGLFFTDVLRAQLLRLNPGIVDEARADGIIRQLTLLRADITGNRDALAWLRGEQSAFVPEENRERNVRLVDFDDPSNNVFHVTDEWRQRNPRFANRADVVFLVNGIPVAICETKNAGKTDGLAIGIDQIRRYHRETPEMLIAPQVFEVTQLLDFYYAATWSTNRKDLFNWRLEDETRRVSPGLVRPGRGENPSGLGTYEEAVKSFFDRRRFLKVLRDYVIFLTKDDELTKVILRQHQTRAVEKVLERVDHPVKRRGLIWHTQGSGKTYTMITIAAKLLREGRGGEKPTVLMLVDRNELEAQLFRNIVSYGIANVVVAQSKEELRRILRSDYRGLIVAMIHKFDRMDADMSLRSDIVVLVDEAHRTTGGDLGNYLLAALPNATYIGFTGTPIDRLSAGKGTFKVFGVDDPQGYLDKYSIAESISDGTTVPLNYALAPSDLRVERATLEREFLDLREAEGVSDQAELDAVLTRAVQLKEMMKAAERVAKIAAFVARHYRENVEPMGFKAFLVGVDREACARYKQALDRYLPPEYSAVVYSPGQNDTEELKACYLTEEQEKQVRKSFIKKDALPRILVVTEKLLTGFDAPVLYCMYLDKPMRDHVLLQAIARVNRPYEDEAGTVKPYGFVLDFVGIFENLEKALAFDSDVVASVIQNIDVLRGLFATLMRERASDYLPLARGRDDKAKERAVVALEDKEKREAFFKFFRQVQSLYDILSPDAFLRPYIEDYQALAVLYAWIRQAYSDRVYVDREFTRKTKDLLQQHTQSGILEPPTVVYEIGQPQLLALRESSADDTVKVLNLRKLIAAAVENEGGIRPYLLSIGERAQVLAEAYENRQISTKEALERFEALVQETVDANAKRRRLDVDENTFAIYTALQVALPGVEAVQARAINALFRRYPDYKWNTGQESALRAELYRMLLPIVGTAQMVAVANILLRLEWV